MKDTRTWFYVAGWPLLDPTACAVLNLTARKVWPAPADPSRAALEQLAAGYRPGATVAGLVSELGTTLRRIG
jgi:hypothetical protein